MINTINRKNRNAKRKTKIFLSGCVALTVLSGSICLGAPNALTPLLVGGHPKPMKRAVLTPAPVAPMAPAPQPANVLAPAGVLPPPPHVVQVVRPLEDRIDEAVAALDIAAHKRFLYADILKEERQVKGLSLYSYLCFGLATAAGADWLEDNFGDDDSIIGIPKKAMLTITVISGGLSSLWSKREKAHQEKLVDNRIKYRDYVRRLSRRVRNNPAFEGDVFNGEAEEHLKDSVEGKLQAHALTNRHWWQNVIDTVLWFRADYRNYNLV